MGGFFDKFTYHIVYIKLNVALKELVRPIIIHISHSLYKTCPIYDILGSCPLDSHIT